MKKWEKDEAQNYDVGIAASKHIIAMVDLCIIRDVVDRNYSPPITQIVLIHSNTKFGKAQVEFRYLFTNFDNSPL